MKNGSVDDDVGPGARESEVLSYCSALYRDVPHRTVRLADPMEDILPCRNDTSFMGTSGVPWSLGRGPDRDAGAIIIFLHITPFTSFVSRASYLHIPYVLELQPLPSPSQPSIPL